MYCISHITIRIIGIVYSTYTYVYANIPPFDVAVWPNMKQGETVGRRSKVSSADRIYWPRLCNDINSIWMKLFECTIGMA